MYSKNTTMRLLGKQRYGEIVTEEAVQEIKAVCRARQGEITENAAIDVYILGFLHGRKR